MMVLCPEELRPYLPWLLLRHGAPVPDPEHVATEAGQTEQCHHVLHSPHRKTAGWCSQHTHRPAKQIQLVTVLF